MKQRLGFVSNSSSSSFLITDTNHKDLHALKKIKSLIDCGLVFSSHDFDIDGQYITDLEDNAVNWICQCAEINIDNFAKFIQKI